MYFLLSGEGPTDLGTSTENQPAKSSDDSRVGPMALLIDQIVERTHDYQPLESNCVEVLPKSALAKQKTRKKSRSAGSFGLPGKKTPKETRYFYNNAKTLARIALKRKKALKDDVVAVLFRDADGTASSSRGQRDDKRDSIIEGFKSESFDRGVAMVPKPKSEAWILCAMRNAKYKNCQSLENESGNDNSPYSLKKQLADLNQGDLPDRDVLCQWVLEGKIDAEKISMPSFDQFKSDLHEKMR